MAAAAAVAVSIILAVFLEVMECLGTDEEAEEVVC